MVLHMDLFSSCSPDRCDDCPAKVVCRCLNVTESEIVSVIATLEVRTVKELRSLTGAGDGCTCCHGRLRDYLETHAEQTARRPLAQIA